MNDEIGIKIKSIGIKFLFSNTTSLEANKVNLIRNKVKKKIFLNSFSEPNSLQGNDKLFYR